MIRRIENDLMRRIVNLPLNIAVGVSRAVGQGMSLIGIGIGRREHRAHFQPPQEVLATPEEWVFLRSYEARYGFFHPFFYACRFAEALKIAEEEKKFLFVYLHSPEHPYTPPFCSETLGSELVVQFLDSNFVSWAAISSGGEGLQMTSALRAASFPFCAVVSPVSSSGIAVLQQVEGPVSPTELVEILQRTTEERGLAFRTLRATEDEGIIANRQLRQQQDAAYKAALQLDKERERLRDLAIEEASVNHQKSVAVRTKKGTEKRNRNVAATKQTGRETKEAIKESHTKGATTPGENPMVTQIQIRFPDGERKEQSFNGTDSIQSATKQTGREMKEAIKESHNKGATTPGENPMVTQIQIRFPDGEKKEQSFSCTDNIQSIYRYMDSLNKPGIGSYLLISNFPRKVYGFEQLEMTLKDAGLHPRATLFLELL